MTKRLVDETSLTTVANAIREKSGESDSLVFPEGFVTAIEGISSGGGGGGDEEFTTALLEGRPANLTNGTASFVAYNLAEKPYRNTLETVNLTASTNVSGSAFTYCTALTDVNLPVCKSLFGAAFRSCFSLKNVSLPACELIGQDAFGSCSALASINLPACTSISRHAFAGCTSLSRVDLGASTMCKLESWTAFPDQMSTTGAFYVPASLISDYKNNWTWGRYSSRIFAIEDASTD